MAKEAESPAPKPRVYRDPRLAHMACKHRTRTGVCGCSDVAHLHPSERDCFRVRVALRMCSGVAK